MAESEATLGYGTVFAIGITSGPTPASFVDMGEITNVTPPSSTVDQVDVTHMSSPDRRREFIDGLINPGECSFDMNYVPGSASDVLLLEIVNTPLGDPRSRRCKITYPNGVEDEFTGNLATYEPTLPTDDKMTATVTFQVTGVVTRTPATP